MDFLKPIDIYCERLDASYWAEPLNAISNLSFIFAAIAALLLWKKHPQLKHRNWILFVIFITIIVGIGSYCFHTFANLWSQFADVIPILILKSSFVLFCLRYIFNFSKNTSAVLLVVFISLTIGLGFPPFSSWLNGSMTYVPTLGFLILLGVKFKNIQMDILNKMATLTAVIFLVSITARSVDMQFCETNPFGTHFIWHALNGLVIYNVIKILIKYDKSSI